MVGEKYTAKVPQYLGDLIPEYLENRQSDVTRINACLESADFETIRHIAHDMRGVGSGYGFPGISDLGQEIGSAARSGDAKTVGQLNARYQDYLNNLDIKYV